MIWALASCGPQDHRFFLRAPLRGRRAASLPPDLLRLVDFVRLADRSVLSSRILCSLIFQEVDDESRVHLIGLDKPHRVDGEVNYFSSANCRPPPSASSDGAD